MFELVVNCLPSFQAASARKMQQERWQSGAALMEQRELLRYGCPIPMVQAFFDAEPGLPTLKFLTEELSAEDARNAGCAVLDLVAQNQVAHEKKKASRTKPQWPAISC
jgi:hypothetical protein